jgi:hypothetical protein
MPRKRACPEFPGRFGEYPNDLLEPIVRQPFFGLLASVDEIKRLYEEKDRDAVIFKFQVLAKHFGIEWGGRKMWRDLALELAMAHVPGLQFVDAPKKKRGKPRRILNPSDPSPFVGEIDAIAAERKKGISDALRMWQRRKNSSATIEALRARYMRGRQLIRDFAAMSNSAVDWNKK